MHRTLGNDVYLNPMDEWQLADTVEYSIYILAKNIVKRIPSSHIYNCVAVKQCTFTWYCSVSTEQMSKCNEKGNKGFNQYMYCDSFLSVT